MIVTSYLFPEAEFSLERLKSLCDRVGKDRLVVDISCRRREGGWVVAMNGWKTLTDTYVTKGELFLGRLCARFTNRRYSISQIRFRRLSYICPPASDLSSAFHLRNEAATRLKR